jgi:subfamily B ATP-binding cassette protein MsbA
MPISGWIISKLAKNRAKSLEAQEESGQLISIVDETLGLKVIKVIMRNLILKVDFMIQ